MDLLLDSHTLLWALSDPARLREDAIEAITDPARHVHYSAASVWELELKAALGKLTLPANWLEAASMTGFRELPVTGAEARESVLLPWHHRDPFDRLLVAQARLHDLQFATRDPLMSAYDVALLPV